ncbi:MAG: trigger factor [Gammaproteobacteria bacterium]|nr:trigger factor [Gammaproteobacteria bacterium]
MQVSVETTQGLERKLTVQLPSGDIDNKVDERLNSLKKTAKVNGFRPGKVPMAIIRKRYGDKVRGEILGDMINSSFYEAVAKEKLRPAGYPQIRPVEAEGGDNFVFDAVFEVYPEFEPANVDSLEIEKSEVEVTAADVDDMLETLRKQRSQWQPVERAAVEGDQLLIDFTGRVDGEEFSGGKAENAPLVLGSGSMIDGFESQLTGMKAGDEKTITVQFPEKYQAEELAGKEAEFDIKVHTVKESVLPEIDEAFVKSFGVEDGSIEKLRDDVEKNMQRELKQAVDNQTKQQIMDGLLELNPLEIPKALVKDEIGRLKQQLVQQMPNAAEFEKLGDEMFTEDAERRVRLGLVIAEIVKKNDIKASPEKVREQVELIASSYQEPQQVIDYYYGNRELLQNVEGLVLEQAVCDWVMDSAKVTGVSKSFKDIMNKTRPPM